MDFQADVTLFSTTNNVFLDVRKHCSAIVFGVRVRRDVSART